LRVVTGIETVHLAEDIEKSAEPYQLILVIGLSVRHRAGDPSVTSETLPAPAAKSTITLLY
jgi:hypothetical protein